MVDAAKVVDMVVVVVEDEMVGAETLAMVPEEVTTPSILELQHPTPIMHHKQLR
jgi:hypothetical protein